MAESTALTQRKPDLVATGDIQAIVPRNVEEAYRLAQMIVGAKLAPDSYKNDPKQIVVGIMKGLEVGLPPLTALGTIAIINGRPCIWGDGAVALAQNSGFIADYKVEDIGESVDGLELNDWPDSYGKRVTIKRKGRGEGTYVGEFKVSHAKRANLWLSHKRRPWIEYPTRMLENRARAFALRDGFADCLAGLSIREEMEDIPMPKPDAAEVSFLDAGLDDPEAATEPTGEPEDTAAPEAQDAEILSEAQPEGTEEDFDYVGHVIDTLASFDSADDVNEFWHMSAKQRAERTDDEQGAMAHAYVTRLQELVK